MNGNEAKNILKIGLAAVCALMLLSLASQSYSYYVLRGKARSAVELKEKFTARQAADIAPRDMKAYADLSQARLFGDAKAPNPGPPSVTGIIGQYALVNGQMQAVGANINGWELVRVDPEAVVFSREGKEQTSRVFQPRNDLVIDNRKGGGGGPPAGGAPRGPSPVANAPSTFSASPPSGGPTVFIPPTSVLSGSSAPSAAPRGSGGGRGISIEEEARLRQEMKSRQSGGGGGGRSR